jgi:hypothetical protein
MFIYININKSAPRLQTWALPENNISNKVDDCLHWKTIDLSITSFGVSTAATVPKYVQVIIIGYQFIIYYLLVSWMYTHTYVYIHEHTYTNIYR